MPSGEFNREKNEICLLTNVHQLQPPKHILAFLVSWNHSIHTEFQGYNLKNPKLQDLVDLDLDEVE